MPSSVKTCVVKPALVFTCCPWDSHLAIKEQCPLRLLLGSLSGNHSEFSWLLSSKSSVGMFGSHNLKCLAWATHICDFWIKESLVTDLLSIELRNSILNIGHHTVNRILGLTLLWIRNFSKTVNSACILNYLQGSVLWSPHRSMENEVKFSKFKLQNSHFASWVHFQQPIPSPSPYFISETKTRWSSQ